MARSVLPSRPRLLVEERDGILEADAARVDDGPEAWAAGGREGARAGRRCALDPGRRVSHLVAHGGRLGEATTWTHRLRRPRTACRCVTIEPFLEDGSWALLVAARGLERASVAGAPVRGLALLRVGQALGLGSDLTFHLTTYLEPTVGPYRASHPAAAARCAVCRGRLEDGQRVQRCECGAILHARAASSLGELECSDLGGCPDCRRVLPPSSGYSWWPDDVPGVLDRRRGVGRRRAPWERPRVELARSRAWDLLPAEVPPREALDGDLRGGAA